MIVNVNRAAQVVVMIPRKEIPGVTGISLANGTDVSAAAGTPYGVHREWLLSPWGAPCNAPPWGELVAIKLSDGTVQWRVPLGSIEKRLPIHFEWNLGTPNLGGPIVTAGGLVPPDQVLVAESGITTVDDARMLPGRVDAVLVGTALMRADDPGPLIHGIASVKRTVGV